MTVRGAELLERLGSGIRPEGAGVRPSGAVGGKGFAALLADVRAGKVSSGRPVEIGPHAGVELTEGQLDRLSVVADAGEAAGASRLGVMIDGQVVTLDILTRMVEGATRDGNVLTGIDGFVVAPESGDADEVAGLLGEIRGAARAERTDPAGIGLGVVRNRSVAELLGTLGDRGSERGSASDEDGG